MSVGGLVIGRKMTFSQFRQVIPCISFQKWHVAHVAKIYVLFSCSGFQNFGISCVVRFLWNPSETELNQSMLLIFLPLTTTEVKLPNNQVSKLGWHGTEKPAVPTLPPVEFFLVICATRRNFSSTALSDTCTFQSKFFVFFFTAVWLQNPQLNLHTVPR